MSTFKKYRYAIIAVVLIVIVGLAGAVYYYTMARGPEVIKLGGVAPLSPPGAYMSGQDEKNGMLLAIDEINAQGGVLGKKIEITVEDTAGTPEKGKAAFEKLITQDHVVGIVGEFHSSVALAEIEVTNSYKIPFVLGNCWSDKVTAKGYKYVFRASFTNSLLYSMYGDFIKQAGFKNVVIIGEDTDYGIGAAEVLRKRIVDLGLTATTNIVSMTTKDFVPMLTRIKDSSPRPDLLALVFTGAGNYIIVKQAYEIGLAPTKQTMLLNPTDEFLAKEFWDTTESAGVYVMGYNQFSPKAKLSDIGKAFVENYKKAFNRDATATSLGGYDATRVLIDAIQRAGSTDGDKVADALEKTDYQGASGRIAFSLGPQEGAPDYMYHQWKNPPLLILQYTQLNQSPDDAEIVWPSDLATAPVAYPS